MNITKTETATKDTIKFGDYVEIEQLRYTVKNQFYLYKVIGRLESNYYVDVPVQCPGSNTPHDEVVDVVACICCGVCETEVLKYRLEDVGIWGMQPLRTQEINE